MNDVMKVLRGQIWFLPELESSGEKSLIRKSRPWLVVSNNERNKTSPVFTCIPISTKEEARGEYQVHFLNGSRHQLALCEQITTRSIDVFISEGSNYVCTVNPDIMAKIDKAILYQLGISLVKLEVPCGYSLNSRGYGAVVSVDCTPKVVEIREVPNGIDSELKNLTKSSNFSPDSVVKPLVEKVEEVPGPSFEKVKVIPKRAKIWTSERKKKFIEDYSSLSKEELLSKYRVSNNSIKKYITDFRKEFGLKSIRESERSWTEPAKRQFLWECNHYTKGEMAKKYSIEVGSVRRYITQFNHDLGIK